MQPSTSNNNKTGNSHPTIHDLEKFVHQEYSSCKSENSILVLHVAECLRCQNILTVLSSLKYSHRTLDTPVVSEGQQNLIVDYINRGFSISRKKLFRQKIFNDPASLKAMLHYASHSEAMRLKTRIEYDGEMSETSTDNKITSNVTKEKFNRLLPIGALLKKFKTRLKWAIPSHFTAAYSVFVSALSIVLILLVLADKMPLVGVYELKELEQAGNHNHFTLEYISDDLQTPNYIYALPGDENKNTENTQNQKNSIADKVNVRLSEKGNLNISWPVSQETILYTLNFYALAEKTKAPALGLATSAPFIELDVTNFEAGKDYRWEFSYQTQGGKRFRARGGFVIKPLTKKY